VFSGPGSPSYALRAWRGTPVADLLTDKLLNGGAVVFASAAALTLGSLTVPVYEIYKAGEDPRWLPGLDVLGAVGISAAVIPHFDNTEGGTHDTRYCYLGERRLRQLEEQMPDDGTFILGIDEHTALMLDLDAGTAAVHGRGGVTLRRQRSGQRLESGQTFHIEELRAGPTATGAGTADDLKSKPATGGPEGEVEMARRLLELEDERATGRERERLVEPLIKVLLDIRDGARQRGDYESADEIRDRLVALGVDVSDSPSGTFARVSTNRAKR
jgi:hypothetical protein